MRTTKFQEANVDQHALSVITRIKPSEFNILAAVLDQIGNPDTNTLADFHAITSLHFCCWVIVADDPRFPPCLVLESNYDGTLEQHLDQLITHAGAGLDAIYRTCEGYPAAGIASPRQVCDYLLANAVPTTAFYIGCPGQSVGSIRNAIAVREAIQGFLDAEDQNGALAGRSALEVHQRIKQFLATQSPVKPEISPITLDQQRTRAVINAVLLGIIALPLLILLLPLIFLFFIVLRIQEFVDAQAPLPPPLPVDPRLFTHEDVYIMNHLTTMVNVKPGGFRLGTLKVILWVVNLLAKAYFTTGNIGGIPTIHFARWLLMENDRRLLFFSNYDGSWASYLGDFVDKANYGLTAIWSNTDRFPPSQFLFWGGAQQIEPFKAWSREHNLYAAVWYSAYPDETLWNLQKDVRLRDTIGQQLSEAQAQQLLQLL